MKRILLSVAISFCLLAAYMTISSTIFILSGEPGGLMPYLDLPVRLPKAVFFYFSPPTAEDFSPALMTQRRIFLTVFFYLANVLLYSIPAYILIRIISRRRRGFESARAEPPPPGTQRSRGIIE